MAVDVNELNAFWINFNDADSVTGNGYSEEICPTYFDVYTTSGMLINPLQSYLASKE